MTSRYICETVKRKLYAESMGRCMNPNCQRELFSINGDIIERAHIDSYHSTKDNSFENLVLLCPNCHTEFDKNHAFKPEEILTWKKIRQEEQKKLFSKKFKTFEELKNEVVPILQENKTFYEKYYLNNNKILWDKFEDKILVNNRKLKELFLANINLIQHHQEKYYSNKAYIQSFIAHIDEFESTRTSEKCREILFPSEINSMFGITPIQGFTLPSTESLEILITKLKEQGKYEAIVIGTDYPYIQINENGKSVRVYLNDTPRLRQLYFDYKCFKGAKVRFESLNYALKYIRSRNINFKFLSESNLREITIHNQKLVFVYEYCLSQAELMRLSPTENSIVVNLHNWNGEGCISTQAYTLAKKMNVQLLTMEGFYEYINQIK